MDVDELFAKHQPALLRYLTRYSGDPDIAADAAQEAYLRLLESPPTRGNNVRAWLFTVATNVVRDGWKRERSELKFSGNPERALAADPTPDPHERAESAERAKLTRQMLEQASEREREILLMWSEGFGHSEIAEAVGTTTGTIAPTIARALKKMAKQIDQYKREDV